ncbi:MAG: hypothetical protein JNL67_21545 [Planctomycetaceae bacterium]|nr:hypothetical protein [Planctomycetaceae bacterium]
MTSDLNRRQALAIFSSWGTLFGISGFMNPTVSAGHWTMKLPGRVLDVSHNYELDLQSEGVVLLGPDEDAKKVAFTMGSQQAFTERAVISDGGSRMASRLYTKAEMTKRFGAIDPETVSIPSTPLAILAMPERPESGRMTFHSFDQPMTSQVAGMLQVPLSPIWLDELATVLFSQKAKLSIGERTNLSADLVAKLFCLEEIRETSIVCEVEKANETQAVLKISGDATGRSLDVASKIRVNASVRAIFETQSLSQLRASFFEQREKGAISPAYAATTKIKLDQLPASVEITAATIRQQQASASRSPVLKYSSAPNRAEFQHNPQWHLVLDQKGAAIWRLISDGEPMTQCNMLFSAVADKNDIDLTAFVREVTESLKENAATIVTQESLRGINQSQIYRVEAIGTENDIELNWVYYLVTDPNGRRAQLVFVTDAQLKEAVGKTDMMIAESLQMQAPPVASNSESTAK